MIGFIPIDVRYPVHMSDKKLSFLIKKLSKELGIDEHNERNVDIIFKNLTFRHKEYQRMNSAVLRSNVATEFNNLVSNGNICCISLTIDCSY